MKLQSIHTVAVKFYINTITQLSHWTPEQSSKALGIMWALRLRVWAREAKICHGTSALGESPCLSLSLYALWDAPQMTQIALVIHERWQSLGSTTLTLTQNGSCFVRRARTRLAAARDIKHPALTTSFCLDALLQDPNLSPFEQAAGLAYWLSVLLPGGGETHCP